MSLVVTRFPPSPTGYLHIGGLRTALYNYMHARKLGGKFVLRIEDTDRERYVPGAVESLIRSLDRMSLSYNEGPTLNAKGEIVEVGNHGPYIQSQRLPIYLEHAKMLLASRHAYYCFCSKDRLDTVRKEQELAKMPMKYDRACTKLSQAEIEQKLSASEPYVLRLKIPEGETVIEDLIRGRIEISNAEVDDQVLMKSDGYPTYHLANVVDDHLMEVTCVIRGEEWISSVPKHVMLYNAFGWKIPEFAHLPLILNADRSKLSKRQGDVAVEDYLDKGYLPEALMNFVALMGFNPSADREIFSVAELIPLFEISKVNKSGAVFNVEKLDWMNGQYIRTKSPKELVSLVSPFLERAGKSVESGLLERVCTIEQERLVKLADMVDLVDGYLTVPPYEAGMLVWKKSDAADAQLQLKELSLHIDSMDASAFVDIALLEASVKEYITRKSLSNGNVLWPLRVALSGRSASPSPYQLLWAFGREESLARLRHALNQFAA